MNFFTDPVYGVRSAFFPAIAISALGCVLGCGNTSSGSSSDTTPPTPSLQHILFVGDSFTHGRYLPVRTYNNTPGTGGLGSTAASTHVIDENYGTSVVARQESQPGETGPWGGIPGIFAEFASEANLPYDVHIEAISETTLAKNYSVATSVVAQTLWNTVILQEATFQPIPASLSGDSNSNPASFCSAVSAIEAGIHGVAPSASIFLYETGAPADTTYQLSTKNSTFTDANYLSALGKLTSAYHDAYLSAANSDVKIEGVAQTGDAWSLAWSQGVANPDPYGGTAGGVSLTFNYQSGSSPSTVNTPTDAGFHHPSIYGAYLNALVLFQRITGTDVRTLGGSEQAASSLGISPAVAVQLQNIGWTAVKQQSTMFSSANYNPCK